MEWQSNTYLVLVGIGRAFGFLCDELTRMRVNRDLHYMVGEWAGPLDPP
jgi:hypothetical protein